jgi:4-amino-4-deoxy-L-arabinose transferase-like glycosyltransferase
LWTFVRREFGGDSSALFVAALYLFVLFGLTPLVFLLCVVGVFQAWKNKKENLVWLIPFFGLLTVFIIQCARGHVLMRPRYSIALALLLLPFAGEAFARIHERRKAMAVAVLTLLSILPFSYSRVIVARTGPSFPNPFPADMEMIPRVEKAPKEIAHYSTE